MNGSTNRPAIWAWCVVVTALSLSPFAASAQQAQPTHPLDALTGADVHVKYENLQVTNSFKDRGALVIEFTAANTEGEGKVVEDERGHEEADQNQRGRRRLCGHDPGHGSEEQRQKEAAARDDGAETGARARRLRSRGRPHPPDRARPGSRRLLPAPPDNRAANLSWRRIC